jgi:hypothetical protein
MIPMLNPDQIKPFILHPELIVSHAAISYFSESNLYLNDHSLMPLVLQRIKQLQKNESFYFFKAYLFPQSKETISEILELLNSTNTEDDLNFQLTNVLLRSPIPLLEPHMGELAKHEAFAILRSSASNSNFHKFKCGTDYVFTNLHFE